MKPTGEEILRASWPKRLQPSFNGVSCLLRDLELDWSTGLPLNDRCPLPHLCSRADLVQAKLAKPHARSLLSMAKLKSARSRHMRAISSRTRMHQTCFGWSGFFWPTSNPLFQGRERSLTGRAGIAVPPPHRPSASLCCERIMIATHELCSHSNEHRDRPLLAKRTLAVLGG